MPWASRVSFPRPLAVTNKCPGQPRWSLTFHFLFLGRLESQILLQLGNSERLEGKAYEAYVSGLRSLLAEFKAKQCKDFDTISQAIIDYRSRFYGDRSKVLPLGDVGL